MTWHAAATTDSFKEKDMLAVEIAGQDVALYRVDDTFFATGNICTHQLAYMTDGYLDGDCIECPLHQAIFNVKTGEVIDGPAKQPLPVFPIRVEASQVWVDLPD